MSADDTGPIHWEDAVYIPDEAKPDAAGLAAHFSAQYLAHAKAFHAAILALPRDATPTDREVFRAAIRDNLPIMHTAWAAAAAIKGWAPERIWAVTVDSDGQTEHEFAYEWLVDGLHPLGAVDVDALVERLTTVRPKPEPAPEGQMVLPVETTRRRAS